MKKLRNLSGVYFREKIDDKWENVCFEELSKEKQKEILTTKSKVFVAGLATHLADTLVEIGRQLDLSKE